MTTFGCGPSIIPPPVAPNEQPVENDGWFPAIDLAALRERVRLRDQVTEQRLRDAVRGAILTIAPNLTAWKANQAAIGRASLAEVSTDTVDGVPRLVLLYQRAIDAFTKAALVERYRDIDLTGAGQRKVGELDDSVGELRRDGIHAVRDILGRTRTSVELI